MYLVSRTAVRPRHAKGVVGDPLLPSVASHSGLITFVYSLPVPVLIQSNFGGYRVTIGGAVQISTRAAMILSFAVLMYCT